MYLKVLVSLKNNRRIQLNGSKLSKRENSSPVHIYSCRGAISGDNTVEAYERLHRAQAQFQELEEESAFWSEKLRLIERSISNTLDDITLKE